MLVVSVWRLFKIVGHLHKVRSQNAYIILSHCLVIHSSRSLKWTVMLTPFLPPASWTFTCKEQNNFMRGCHIKSKLLASKGYLPSQLQEMLTLVRKYAALIFAPNCT